MNLVNVEPIWAGYANPDGEPLVGFFALQQALYDRYAKEYTKGNLRICTVGPAAKYTREGAIGSSPIRKGAFTPVVDWAGRKNVERMTYELFNENSGICRFHRKWAEAVTDEILSAHYTGFDANYKAHQFQLAHAIYEREAPKIIFWESQRVMDMVMGYLEQWESDGLRTPELMEWLGRFREDRGAAVKAYWQAIYNGIKSAFEAGPEAIPDNFTPGQQGKLQTKSY